MSLPEYEQHYADYALVLDAVGKLAKIRDEKQIIEEIFNFLQTLINPGKLIYLPLFDGVPGEVQARPLADVNKERLLSIKEDYAYTKSKKGFIFKLRSDGRVLGVIEVDNVKNPKYLDDYLNLILSSRHAFALAISNSRLYEEVKEKEAELSGALDLQSNILSSISEGFVALNKEYRYVYVNEKAAEILGKTREELVGGIVWELFPDFTDTLQGEKFREAMEKQIPVTFELNYEPLNKIMETKIFPYANGISAYFSDITKNKRETEQSEALNYISSQINKSLDFDEIAETAIEESIKVLKADIAGILVARGNDWEFAADHGQPMPVKGTILTNDDVPQFALAASTRKPVVIDDGYNDDRVNPEVMKAYESRCAVLVPLIIKDDVIGIIAFANREENQIFEKDQVDFVVKLAASLTLALENARLFQRTADLLKAQEDIANKLQESMNPIEIPKIEGLDIEIAYQSMTEKAKVGGDFYDVFLTPGGKVAIVMGDVSGKGIDASTETGRVKYLLLDRAHAGLNPESILNSVNKTLEKQKTDRFTALTFALYDPITSIFTFSNAGNPYPYFLKEDRFLETTGVPLSLMPDSTYENIELRLVKGDTLFFFTDGLTDTRIGNDFFGDERIRLFVKNNKDLPLRQLLDDLIQEATDFSHNNFPDDFLVIAIKKK